MTEAMEASEGQCERCDASLASHLLLINEINYIISENGIYSLRHLHTVATAASSYSRRDCGIFIQTAIGIRAPAREVRPAREVVRAVGIRDGRVRAAMDFMK